MSKFAQCPNRLLCVYTVYKQVVCICLQSSLSNVQLHDRPIKFGEKLMSSQLNQLTFCTAQSLYDYWDMPTFKRRVRTFCGAVEQFWQCAVLVFDLLQK